MREIYSKYPNPHCSRYGAHEVAHERDLHDPSDVREEHTCTKYIYNLDYGYHSMVSEVSFSASIEL